MGGSGPIPTRLRSSERQADAPPAGRCTGDGTTAVVLTSSEVAEVGHPAAGVLGTVGLARQVVRVARAVPSPGSLDPTGHAPLTERARQGLRTLPSVDQDPFAGTTTRSRRGFPNSRPAGNELARARWGQDITSLGWGDLEASASRLSRRSRLDLAARASQAWATADRFGGRHTGALVAHVSGSPSEEPLTSRGQGPRVHAGRTSVRSSSDRGTAVDMGDFEGSAASRECSLGC